MGLGDVFSHIMSSVVHKQKHVEYAPMHKHVGVYEQIVSFLSSRNLNLHVEIRRKLKFSSHFNDIVCTV